MATVIRFPETNQIEAGFCDWLQRRAYLDNGGNYRLRATRRIAPWNKAVKRSFTETRSYGAVRITLHSNEAFHNAAHAWQDAR